MNHLEVIHWMNSETEMFHFTGIALYIKMIWIPRFTEREQCPDRKSKIQTSWASMRMAWQKLWGHSLPCISSVETVGWVGESAIVNISVMTRCSLKILKCLPWFFLICRERWGTSSLKAPAWISQNACLMVMTWPAGQWGFARALFADRVKQHSSSARATPVPKCLQVAELIFSESVGPCGQALCVTLCVTLEKLSWAPKSRTSDAIFLLTCQQLAKAGPEMTADPLRRTVAYFQTGQEEVQTTALPISEKPLFKAC